MRAFWQMYDVVERTFFYTLTRKIVGNITFLFLFQVANFYLFYQVASAPSDERSSLFSAMITLSILGAFSFAFTIFYLHYLIVRPVHALLDTLNNINHTQGNLATRLPAFTQDEFRDVSNAYNLFAENLGELIYTINKDAERASTANDVMASVIVDVNQKVDEQKTLTHNINTSTHSVSHRIEDIVGAAHRVSTTNQQNLSSVKEANENLLLSHQQIEKITALLQQFSTTVTGLQDNADNVRNILKMVEEFADQTNLLALNAAIEAARAGDAGRGFAVVADEVRTLSAKVADATQNISHFLSDMEVLVGETQQESTKLMNASDTMKVNIDATTSLFQQMMNDFQHNIEAFTVILSSVNALKEQHQQSTDKVEQITCLSDDIQSQMAITNKEAKQAQSLALATQEGLRQFTN